MMTRAMADVLLAIQENLEENDHAAKRLSTGTRDPDHLDDVIFTLRAQKLSDRAKLFKDHQDAISQAMSWVSVTQHTVSAATLVLEQIRGVLDDVSTEIQGAQNPNTLSELTKQVQKLGAQVDHVANNGTYQYVGSPGLKTSDSSSSLGFLVPNNTAAVVVRYVDNENAVGLSVYDVTIETGDIKAMDFTDANLSEVGIALQQVNDRISMLRNADLYYTTTASIMEVRASFTAAYIGTLEVGAEKYNGIDLLEEGTRLQNLQTRTFAGLAAFRLLTDGLKSNPLFNLVG